MRRSLGALALTALSLALASPARGDCNDPFAKPGEVLDFHIRIKKADWQALKASSIPTIDSATMVDSPACTAKFPEYPVEFRCGPDGPWLKVGLRKKKGTERGVEAPEKPPLKIDINEDFMGKVPEAKGQRWPAALGDLGYRKLTLNNGQGNKPAQITEPLLLPILLSEHVTLRLLKREVSSSPATAYARLTLYFDGAAQGEYHGVYILIEDVDRNAVKRRWGKADGRLLKASTPDCTAEVEYDDGPPNDAAAAFQAWIDKDPAKFPGTWLAESNKGVDVDSLLRQEAIREILVNGNDTIINSRAWLVWNEWGLGNNWLAYDPPKGVRQYMPWDVDLSFGNQNSACAPNQLACRAEFPLLDYCKPMPTTPGWPQTKSKVGQRTACHPEIQKRYLQIMCQLTNGPMSAPKILEVWEEANRTVRPIIPQETAFIWGGKDPLSTTTFKSYGSEYERLKRWIPDRIRSVQQQITALGVPCSAGCMAGAKDTCSYLGCPGERRCENNQWTECRGIAPGCPPPPTAGPSPDGGAPATDARPPGGDGAGPGGSGGAGGGTGGVSGGGSGGATGAGGSSPPGTGGGTTPPRTGGTPRGGAGGGGEPDPTTTSMASGCGCVVGQRWQASGAGLLGPLLAALAALRARRRRR
jgi:hypothetical protein